MSSKLRKLFVSLAALGNVYVISDAYADQTLVATRNISLKASLDIGGDAFFLPNTNFGTGSYREKRTGGYALIKDTTYAELYGKPILAGQWKTPWGFSVFGQASAIGSTTLGDGDAESISQTTRTPRAVTLEEASLGIDLPFNKERKLIIEGGRQKFQIDDGFLMGKGAYSSGDRGAWWYAPRFAFSGPGVIKYQGKALRADVFMLENNTNNKQTRNNDRPETKFEGFDITWFRSRPGGDGGSVYEDRAAYLTLTYFHVRKANIGSAYDYANRGDRQGMNVSQLSWGGTFVPIRALGISKHFTLYGTFVSEQNSHAGNGYKGVSAYSTYIEPGYTFTSLPWKPHVFYRYTRFSGGKNPHSRTKHNYDTYFLYDGRRYTYGGYWPGEITGMYLSPLSNMEIHQVDLTGVPPVHLLRKADELKLGLHFYDLSFLYPTGSGLSRNVGSHMSDELDFSAEYTFDGNTSGAIAGGVAFAGPAGKALAKAGVPGGMPMPPIHGTSGVLELYFYRHF
ncbi:alginate export family protein [Bombella apis]|uniref:hypothetical protein n=1 Tax=Bombella apis TaxID=1785988 RepID=UPI0012B8F8AF|nr:hypothetical protein [Bombella apis]MPW00742.1 hypothetical protein [Bombella apis]